MENNSFDKKTLRECIRFIFVPYPFADNYKGLEGFAENCIYVSNGLLVKEDWAFENTPDHEGCSYQDIAEWGNDFDEYFDIDLLDADESVTEARNQFIHEMETGEIVSIDEFAEKYKLDK